MRDNKTPMDVFLEYSSMSGEEEISVPVTFKVKQGTLILPAIPGWQYLFEADGIKCIKATEK